MFEQQTNLLQNEQITRSDKVKKRSKCQVSSKQKQ